MKKILSVLIVLTSIIFVTGCETTQPKEDAVSEAYVPVVQQVKRCTKVPLMADLTKSYRNRVYLEDGMPCTKDRSVY